MDEALEYAPSIEPVSRLANPTRPSISWRTPLTPAGGQSPAGY
jgi:hypothetical protein